MYDHAKFCAALAHAPFGLDVKTVAGKARAARAGQILDLAVKHDPKMDVRFLAYDFATAFWESGWTLAPVREKGEGRGKPYGVARHGIVYYGRGLVQTTWYANYLKLTKLLGVDCVNHPDLLLQMEYAAPALFEALEQGIYTTKKLGDYFNAHTEDAYHARRCVNGLDNAAQIAGFYRAIKPALITARLAA